MPSRAGFPSAYQSLREIRRMAATPPRPATPASRPLAVPKSGHALQISPDLEALLKHDELTRRSSSSPTNAYHTRSSPEFPISLPPPPPRTPKGSLKGGQREQGPFLATRSKEAQRRRMRDGSDFWPDALPMTFPPDGSAVGQATPTASSRPVTPNPYLNPAPTLGPINITSSHSATGIASFCCSSLAPRVDQATTPKQSEKTLPTESQPPSLADTQGRAGASDSSHRPSKAEKMLWVGRDSLHLFSGSANGVRRPDSDRRNDHAECGDTDAVQDGQTGYLPVTAVSRPPSRFAHNDTAMLLSSRTATSHPQHAPHTQSPETPSTCPLSFHAESGPIGDPTSSPVPPHPPAQRLPRLSLPSISMSHHSSPRLPSVDSLTSRDYLSFIDFLSPPISDGLNPRNVQDTSRDASSLRRQPQSISIPASGLYSASHHNLSSSSLASMRFAPPSPTSLALRQLSPVSACSNASSSSVALSSMMFAPPSPCADHVFPSRLQPPSEPPSPYSPLEFAPLPISPQENFDTPSPPLALDLAFERGRMLKSGRRSMSLSPNPVPHSSSSLPPTTNQLGASERADRIRRNRKLARVFGRMPGTEEPVADSDEPRMLKKLHSPSLAALLMKQKNHRHAVSVSVSYKVPDVTKTEPSTPWQTDDLWSSGGRRHSIPLATSSFRLYMDDGVGATTAKDSFSSHAFADSLDAASARSFIDLSDEENCDNGVSASSFPAPQWDRQPYIHHSSSTPSVVESLDSEAQAEAERRRKREKLAKLHRFLGSRVPPEAVNGSVFGPPLPPPAVHEEFDREHGLRGNKNTPQDGFDRGKEELDEREKALNVRRAQKMERVFGIPPPQTLFHTRPSRSTMPVSQPTSPTVHNPYILTLDFSPCSRNPNQSAYMGKTSRRQGPSESSRCLLPHNQDTPQSSPSSFAQSFPDPFSETLPGFQEVLARSCVYLNYQHSLNSLVDIIDRDDRKSLVELHRFLHEEVDDSPLEEGPVNLRRTSNAASFRSERRHSLPSNASMTSLSSEFLASPKVSRLQIRRRKAAKLTNFFGVDYRELIQDILESIEKGVEEECKQGMLQPQEVEALMHRVRSLRTLKGSFPC